MSPSATPATQSGAAPRATKTRPSAPPEPAPCHKHHTCHAKWRWMSPSATPTTQMEGGCHQVPRLPHKVNCHGKGTSMSPSATPAMQSGAAPRATKTHPSAPPEPAQCHKYHACHAKWSACHVKRRWCHGVWKMVYDKVVCERWCVTKMCVKDGVVKDGVWQSGVWEWWCVKDSVWQRGCVKDGVRQRWCVTMCDKDGVWQRCAGGRERERDTESKTRAPYKDVGKYIYYKF